MKEEQLRELIADMSLNEKVGQLLQVAGSWFDEEALVTGALDYFKIAEEERDLCGSILSVSGADKIKELQDSCMEKQPHHIPQLFMLDIINGYETIYPVPLAQGATFDPAMTEKLAAMAAREGAAAGIHVTFSPMVDLVRDARWGRVMESTGEDAYLNSRMGAAMVRGYQGDDISAKGKMAACVKHFAAYGAPEGGREYDTVELSERTLRDEYLPAYLEAIRAGARLVMTSFNTINHVPSSGNQWLMRQVLREEMGFDGMLISDYGAVGEMINHGIARDEMQAAELALKAGVDMEMMSLCYVRGIKQLLEQGRVSMELLDESVYRVLALKNELGLFENPYKDADAEEEKALCLCEEHRRLAQEAACASFVLLENKEQLLPFGADDAKSVAFIGPFVDSTKVYGSWSFPKSDESIVTIRQGVEHRNPKESITYCQGSHFFSEKVKLKNGEWLAYDEPLAKKLLNEAVCAAKSADRVVMCIGEYPQQTGEAASRTVLQVPQEQMKLLRSVREVNENIVTLVFTGRPLELEEIKELSKAVMVVWMPGTECGNAVAKVLWGEKEPGGRLPMSFPYRATQMPCYYNRFRGGRPNNGTLEQSYVLGYIDQIDRMLYPFGFGRSYTTFAYGAVKLSGGDTGRSGAMEDTGLSGTERPVLKAGHPLTASVTVKNTGDREGTETVQMYLADLYGSVVRPVRQLRGFKKVTLKPGEEREATFEITEEMLRFYNIDMEYVSEPGECRVYIGADSNAANAAEFVLE